MNKPLTVYRASAGSGKTFRLAVEYIKLVVSDPMAYRNILAVTFTNKATEEMKMRILSQLYGIWKQISDSDVYTDKVCSELHKPKDWVRTQAGIALANLIHNYSYFRVMTIDTFFQSVLRNLARELDLTANLRVGLNDLQVMEVAVDQMIEDLSAKDPTLQWILKYVMDSISDDRSWNVIGQIKQFGRTIFQDCYKGYSRDLNDKLQAKGVFEDYTRQLLLRRNEAKAHMAAYATTFFETLEANGLTTDDLANKQKGIASFFCKLKDGVFDESTVNATVANCLDTPEKWYAKTHPRRDALHALATAQLMPLLRQAVDDRPRQWRDFQSAAVTLKHLSQLRLLNNIERKVRQVNEDANRFLLSDTQQLLHSLISDSDTPFIFEKIGAQLEHVMIDEFQDTSVVQWNNFLVLLRETMSHANSHNLIVGDVKQSIYRWRNGDWRLLNDIDRHFSGDLSPAEPLNTNRRSQRTIIEFNNDFFTKAVACEHALLADHDEGGQLTRAYQEVVQEVPDYRGDEGYVSIKLLLDGDGYQEAMLAETLATVCQLTDSGIRQGDIAILVRVNKLIPLIAHYFAVHRPDLVIVSDEAFRLDSSVAVNILVQALHLLTHPDDELSRAFLVKAMPHGLPDDYTAHSSELLTMPLYDLAEKLFALFALDRYHDQSAYLCKFFDELNAYIADNAASIDGFLSEWESSLYKKTIQSDRQDGIRLISIHKSKGLEFDNVIIPFCDWQLEKTNDNIIWCEPKEAPYSILPVVPVDYSRKGMMGTVYEPYYHEEHLQNVVDNLNLLYVAFTRAGRNLFVFGKRNARNSRSAVIEAVLPELSGTLVSDGADGQPLHFCRGRLSVKADAAVSHTSEPLSDKTEEQSQTALDAGMAEKGGTKSNVFLQPSALLPVALQTFETKAAFRQSNQSRLFLSDGDGDGDGTTPAAGDSYIRIGSVLHNVFSTIRTTDDIDAALLRLETDGILAAPYPSGTTAPSDSADAPITRRSLLPMLRQRLEHPKVREWFSPRWTVFNECTILSTEQGKAAEHRPDRVMTDGKEWIVVDFKFGNPRSEYHQQVRRYMELLRQMGHTQVRGYLWYVYSNTITEVII